MKTPEECEEVLRILVKDHLVRFQKPKALQMHSESYRRICAQISPCELIGAVPETVCEELRCEVDDGYKLAIAQSK